MVYLIYRSLVSFDKDEEYSGEMFDESQMWQIKSFLNGIEEHYFR